jgi:hypothetical protein
MVARLADERGRNYLLIVAQLAARFPTWRDARRDIDHGHLLQALDLLERRPANLPEPVRRERLVAMMQLMTASLAERARLLDSGGEVLLDDADYAANLTDMLAGVLGAPATLPA